MLELLLLELLLLEPSQQELVVGAAVCPYYPLERRRRSAVCVSWRSGDDGVLSAGVTGVLTGVLFTVLKSRGASLN